MRTCPHCGAQQPSSFDAFCEACGKLLEETGQPVSDKITESGSPKAVITSITETAPPPLVIPVDEAEPFPRPRCPKCDAAQVIRNVQVAGAVNHTMGVAVELDQEAVVFKGAVTRQLSARVCGSCGFVEFYVPDPKELWDAALLSPERYGLAVPKPPRETVDGTCLACGEPMPEEVSTCGACGWTYAAPEPS